MNSTNWKIYGGTNHYEHQSTNAFNNLIVGNLTLKNDYLGYFGINGKLTVSQAITGNGDLTLYGNSYTTGGITVNGKCVVNDVSMGGNLYVASSIYVAGSVAVGNNFIFSKDVTIGGNAYMSRNMLSLGYNTSSNNANWNNKFSGRLVCNQFQPGAFMGINTPYSQPPYYLPGSTLDIFSDSSSFVGTTTALNVFSTGPMTQSVVTSNQNRQGTILYTDVSHCSIHMFSDTPFLTDICYTYLDPSSAFIENKYVNYVTNGGDARITYSYGGNMQVKVKNNVDFPSHISVGTASASALHTPWNETIAAFSQKSVDVSSTLFSNYYETADNIYHIQHALTLQSQGDASSATFVDILNPSGRGFHMGAGTYIHDISRSMMVMGVNTDNCGNWTPSQMVVSGKNPTYYLSTTGFNTYAPITENYVVNINGPTCITNTDIVMTVDNSFQITGLVTCAYNTNVAIAFGAPIISNGVISFTVLSSINGCRSWQSTPITGFTNLSVNNTNLISSGFIHSPTCSILSLNAGGYIFVSGDGNQTWQSLSLLAAGSISTYFSSGCNSIRIASMSDGSILVPFLDTFSPTLYYFTQTSDASLVSHALGNANAMTIPYNTITLSQNANDVGYATDGYDSSYLFVVGTFGVQKYPIVYQNGMYGVAATASVICNNGYTYNSVQTYKTYTNGALNGDSLFSIFVGNGIITVTKDGGRSFIDTSFNGMNFTGVVITSLVNAMAIGNSGSNGGVIYTTYDGGVTWISPYLPFNGSGTAGLLMGNPKQLLSICALNASDFIINRCDAVYNPLQVGFGHSKFFFCHVPNVFNLNNQVVLDICGSVHVAGAVNVDNVVCCNALFQTSDPRIKAGVRDITENVDDLRPVFYKNILSGQSEFGLLANEVQEVFPFLVHGGDGDGFQSLNYNGLVGLLVKEIQSLKSRVQVLESTHA